MFFKYMFVVLTAVSMVKTQFLPNGCPSNFHIHLLLPHESDCAKYYQCSNGNKIEMPCGAGTVFDFNLQTCNWPWAVQCQLATSTQASTTTTEATTTTREATTRSTETSFTTTEGITMTTDVGTTSTSNNQFLPNGCPSDFHVHLLLPHESDCAKFYQCSNGIKIEMPCSPGTIFDFKLQICNWPWAVECQLATTTKEATKTTTESTTTTAEVTTTTMPTTITTTEFITTTIKSTTPNNPDTTISEPTDDPGGSDENYSSSRESYETTDETTEFPFTVENTSKTTEIWTTVEALNTTVVLTTTESSNVTQPLSTTEVSSATETSNATEVISTTEAWTTTEILNTTDAFSTAETSEQTINTETAYTTEESFTTTTKEITATDMASTTIPPPLCSPGFFGNVPHPERCDAFYMCTGGVAILLSCNTGFEFDPDSGRCVRISDDGCTASQASKTTTEVVTTIQDVTTSEINEDISTTEAWMTTETSKTTDAIGTTESWTITEASNATDAISTTETWMTTETSNVTDSTSTTQSSTITEMSNTTDAISTTEAWTTIEKSNTTEAISITEAWTTTEATNTMDVVTTTEALSTTETLNATEVISTTEAWMTTESLNTTVAFGTTEINEQTSNTETAYTTEESFTTTTKEITATDMASTTIPPPLCSPGFFGNVPHPERCDAFYMCTGGVAILLSCNTGFEFDPDSGRCVPISDSGCTASQASKTTTEVPTTKQDAMTSQVTKDITTTETVTTPSDVTSSEEITSTAIDFTEEEKTTTMPPSTTEEIVTTEAITVTEEHTTIEVTSTTVQGSGIEEVGNTETIITTENTIATQEQSTTEFVPTTVHASTTETTEETVIPEEETTTEIPVTSTVEEVTATEPEAINPTATTAVPLCPSNYFGNRPHPELCDSYFLCTAGIANQLFCREGHEFDPEESRCVPISDSGCTASQASKTTTEVPTTIQDAMTSEVTKDITTTETVTTQSDVTSSEEITSTAIDFTVEEKTTTMPPSTAEEIVTTEAITVTEEHTTIEVTSTTVQGSGIEEICNTETIITTENTIATQEQSTTEIVPTTVHASTTETTEETVIPEEETTTEIPVTSTVEEVTATEPEAINPTATTAVPLCPSNYFGNRPHPELCDSYFLCTAGIANQLFCREGHEFDPEESRCVEISDSGCTASRTTTDQSAATEAEGITEDSTTEKGGSDGEQEYTSEATAKELEVTTEHEITIEVTTEKELCPIGHFGNVAHPELCDSFFMCTAGIANQLFCNEGNEFNPEQGRCVEISDSGCTASRLTTDQSIITEAPVEGTTAEPILEEESGNGEQQGLTTASTVKEVEVTTEREVAVEVTTEKELCPIGFFGNVAHPELCNSFFMCTAGIANQLFCNEGHEFDPNERRCVVISDSGCTAYRATTDESTATEAAERETAAGTAAEEEKGDAGVKEITTKATVKEVEVTTEVTTEEELCPLGYFGNVAHPELCNSFFMCTAGIAHQLFCNSGYEFDPIERRCVDISASGCTASRANVGIQGQREENSDRDGDKEETLKTEQTVKEVEVTMEKEPCPAGYFGNVAHPVRCDSFYMCVGGAAIQLYCREGFEFDPQLSRCVAVSVNGCFATRP